MLEPTPSPIPNGVNGVADHDDRGRFRPGNKAASGRAPSRYAKHRQAVFDAAIDVLTPAKVTEVLTALAEIALDKTAKAGDRVNAAKIVLERGMGQVPADVESEDRLGELERHVTSLLEVINR